MRLSDPDKIFILNYTPIFANLDSAAKNLIAQKSKVVEYKKGDIIYKQHDPADAFYCVIMGRVRITTTSGFETETLEYLNCGKYFGIISLLTAEPHSVNAQAVNDSKILKIPKDDFQFILNKIPQLAIDLSLTLSRRLRKKDVQEKRIFESNIISVFGAIKGLGRTMYATELALSLRKETNKKVVVVEISEKCTILKEPAQGAAILNIIQETANSVYPANLNALLTRLTADYHYVIVDLPTSMDEVVFEALKQSDIINIITDYDVDNLVKTRALISELFEKLNYPREKIKVVINERKEGKPLSSGEVFKFLNYNIYATLPATEYAKAIRRIARELGDVRSGLALSGGAALGLAHIGVIKVLEKENIPIDMVAGSSMGALLGALWASGLNSKQIEEITLGYNNNRKKTFHLLMDFCFPKLSFAKGRRIRDFLDRHIGEKTFQDVKFPFKIIACNINKSQKVIFDSGRLSDAVMASIAIPGVFAPTKINNDLIVDGGIIEPVPVGTLVRLGIKKIIAVNVLPSPENMVQNYTFKEQRRIEKKEEAKRKGFFAKMIYELRIRFNNIFFPNLLDIVVNSIQTMEYVISESDCQKADIVLRPQVLGVDWFDFHKVETLIKKGEEETYNALVAIKNVIYGEAKNSILR